MQSPLLVVIQVLYGWSLDDPKYANVTTLMKASCKRKLDHVPPPSATGSSIDTIHTAEEYEKYQCGYLFADWGIWDTWLGLILLALSLALLCTCLILLVKILNSLMRDRIAQLIKDFLNADIPGAAWLTGYVAILVGVVITFLVQSSSVFTSTLTPLCGTGLITIERAYPLTLGKDAQLW